MININCYCTGQHLSQQPQQYTAQFEISWLSVLKFVKIRQFYAEKIKLVKVRKNSLVHLGAIGPFD